MATTVEAPVALGDLPRPRWAEAANLLEEILGAERQLAALYDQLALRTTTPALAGAFAELAQAKRARAERLEQVRQELGPAFPTRPAPPLTLGPWAWRTAHALAHAFEAERALEERYREVLSLLGDVSLPAALAALAAEAARHQALLRRLYLRYS